MKSFLASLVRLLPEEFEERFGAEMMEQIQRDYDRARSRSRLKALGFALAAMVDLARSAVVERWSPSWKISPSTARREDVGMIVTDWTTNLWQGLRTLRRSPGFFVVAVGTLGLAIGANTGIFSVVDTVLLKPLPYPNADRLVYIGASAPGTDLPEEFGVSGEFYLHYREQSELLENAAMYGTFTATLRADDRTERVWMSIATTPLLEMLGVTPALGRLPLPEDDDRVVLLSHALWTSWFGRDPSVLGRTFDVAGSRRTVIGVMGPDFWFPNNRVLLWIPYVMPTDDITPGRFGGALVGLKAAGVRDEALVAELGGLAQQLPERFGGSANYARIIDKHRPIVRPLEQELLGVVSGPLWVLLGSVGIVLLIACANVANLFTVRGEHRQRELAVRQALGATRGRLIRTQMAEAVVVAVLAGLVAVVLAYVSVPLLLRAAPPNLPRLEEVSLTGTTLLLTAAACAFSALLCSLVPAVRFCGPQMMQLRDGARGSTRRRRWGQNVLVVAQTALALVLLIGSALLVRSFQELRNVDPGYDVENVFTFQIAPEGEHLDDPTSFARFHMSFVERIEALPGVESVGLVENVPLNEGVPSRRFRSEHGESGEDAGTLLSLTWAGADYFETMGIEMLRGRAFTKADLTTDVGNVIVSQAAASLLWPGENPLGRRLQREDSETWETVIGVVEDVLQYEFRDEPEPLVYLPLVSQSTPNRAISSPAYVVKTDRADAIAPEVRALVREVVPNAPMYRVYTMEELASSSMVRLSFTVLTLLIASVLALILGTIGLYGVLSYVVAARRRELGVRLALGAGARRVRAMVVAQGARIVAIGVAIGVVVARGTTRVLGSLLFEVEAIDTATFAATAAAMIVVGLVASYMPARRASSVDPIETLRSD